jgi:hypothetical protein
VNGWFSYQLASWVSLFFPVEVDKAMHVSLCEQFPDFPKRKPNAQEIEALREACFVFLEARKHGGYGMDDAESAVRAALNWPNKHVSNSSQNENG